MSICLSVVSHNNDALVDNLLRMLDGIPSVSKVVVTYNIGPNNIPDTDKFSFELKIVRNGRPLGYGANNNNAFRFCEEKWFCVVNPDISFPRELLDEMIRDRDETSVGILAPQLVSPTGQLEVGERSFPHFAALFKKLLLGISYYDRSKGKSIFPKGFFWVSGAFMLFSARAFRSVGGFDEKYFMYLEDVDICLRLLLAGYPLELLEDLVVAHEAQRASHRNFRHLSWHVSSMFKFFYKFRRYYF
jgi:N-acetylglucosaminyl-diphospho-decaprenol L-rhamnosyltransferase